MRAAATVLRRNGIDSLVAIGGDGTFRGCLDLARFWNGAVIGCPGTIDNDLAGTDVSIGFTSAVSTAATPWTSSATPLTQPNACSSSR